LLLALLQVFGGKLGAVDYYKLMFLLCQRTKQNHYDFFPYKYGACSFLLQQDKLRLIQLGYLESDEGFIAKIPLNFVSQLNISLQSALLELASEARNLRGDDLLKQVYLDYPYYASRSTIASRILNKQEYEMIKNCANNDNSISMFTIGYEGITIDKYLNKLIQNNIHTLVDVRKNPISQKYGFSKNQLKRYVESIGIDYLHLPDLGVPSSMRKNLDSDQAYNDLFAQYRSQILPEHTDSLGELKDLLVERKRIALTCFEALHTHCHRSEITTYFQNDPFFSFPIIHL
jgi:uncharacterized protein (DUF488 family)